METDYLLSSARWDILKIISEKPSSPIQIAEKLNTTVSHVSQQLRLLEAAGLVTKKKTGETEKGKPRTLFSISKDMLYLIAITKKFSGKKLLFLDKCHEIILKIWMIENQKLHHPLEKFFWKIEKFLGDIEAIILDESGISPKIIIVSSKLTKSKIETEIKDLKEKINFVLIKNSEISKLSFDSCFIIYTTALLEENFKKLKGGDKNE